jgi:hypothetical protein
MFWAVVLEIGAAPTAEKHAFRVEQAGAPYFRKFGPMGRAIGRDPFGFSGSPDRHRNRGNDGGNPARPRESAPSTKIPGA